MTQEERLKVIAKRINTEAPWVIQTSDVEWLLSLVDRQARALEIARDNFKAIWSLRQGDAQWKTDQARYAVEAIDAILNAPEGGGE